MKRRIYVIAAVAAAVVAAGVSFWLPRMAHERTAARPTATTPAESSGDSLSFPAGAPQLAFLTSEAAVLEAEPLLEALPGRIAYDENVTARVSAPLAGRVDRIVVSLGQRVARGALLATIDAPEYAQAQADAKRTELEVKQKRQVFERAKLLFDGEVIPRRDFEAAETDLREAEVERTRAKRRLESLAQGFANEGGELPLLAPVSGIVTERAINPGTRVGPDTAAPLFVITDPVNLRVIVDVPEQHLGVLRLGQGVAVEVDAYPGRRFEAIVVHVGDVLDANTRRVQIRCKLGNPDGLLKPEMYARVTPLSATDKRVRVPSSALVTAGVRHHVFVETRPGVFTRRPVTPATQGRDFAYLKDGVAPGERVVTSGALLLDAEMQGR